MKPGISKEAWLSALEAGLAKPTREGFTVLELVALAQLPPVHSNVLKVRGVLRGEIAAGRIMPQKGYRVSIDGAMRQVPIYVPVKK